MMPIRKGTATRLGLRRSGFMVLAEITNTPRGTLRAVCTYASGRSFFVDATGRAVHDTGMVIRTGQIRDEQGWRRVHPYGT